MINMVRRRAAEISATFLHGSRSEGRGELTMLLLDCEEDRTLCAVLAGMLRETDRPR
jgi:hypothetical protein